jgi:RNA polymerase sigma factor (sigma-70 family)
MRRFGTSLNRADAEDAVSEVLIRLHRRMEQGRPPANLRAAFFTSVRNAAIDTLRSRSAKPTVALEAAINAPTDRAIPDERAVDREDAARLQEALRRMRGNYRETIILRFGYGLTVPEIAEHLGVSLPAAKKLVLRATQQAKARYATIEGEEAHSFGAAVALIAAATVAKLRSAAFKVASALQSAEASTTGMLAGTGQKIAAVCGAATATTATCLVTGIVGPGIGAATAPPSQAPVPPPPKVRTVASPSLSMPAPISVDKTAPAPENDSVPKSSPPPQAPPVQADSQPSAPPVEFSIEAGTSSTSASSSESSAAPEGATGKNSEFGF